MSFMLILFRANVTTNKIDLFGNVLKYVKNFLYYKKHESKV